MTKETLVPMLGIVTDVRVDTPDVKTFRVNSVEGGKCFEHMPGQCAMLSIPGVGEAMFSIKKCGCLTNWLHQMDVGQMITVRGPYGNAFPVEEDLKGQDLLFIAGGIGLAPLRSVINYVRAKRENYGKVRIVYGARSKDDLVDYPEIVNEWCREAGIDVFLTIDQPQEGWEGHVGFVPSYVTELGFDPQGRVLVCGPPVMIRFTTQALIEMGFEKTQIYTTMELRMKCGVGKCGRCNIGDQYVCKDGPVFRFDKLGELPAEY